ncbi:MAG TPA: aminotransferase class I/II-fold pyridoxal phosphate-dependent enzyme [Micropruina sp.]|nr:aminotransferase class I/II-fold pyridoxal phosphate-dependent enzyme [Micropruina sp.]
MSEQSWSPETAAVVAGRPPHRAGAAVSPPVELTSTYVSWEPFGATDPGIYGRMNNATWLALEEAVGALERGTALCFAAGMAAGAALFSLVPEGGRVVMADSCYGSMLSLAQQLADAGRFALVLVDVSDTDAVVAAMPGADWLVLESPTNPLMQVADLIALGAAAARLGVRIAVDNTFATPLLQNPLELGASVVMHSGTKYLAGHSDVVLGLLVVRDEALLAQLRAYRGLHGGILGPMEAWLALRGLRTLAVRLERQQASAAVLADRLSEHPAISRVRYPGLPSDPGHQRAKTQMRGFGGMLSIELADGRAAADDLVRGVRLWVPATSLGGVESLIERRRRIPAEPHTVPENLVRLSVGLEHVDDLWADLEQALDRSAG